MRMRKRLRNSQMEAVLALWSLLLEGSATFQLAALGVGVRVYGCSVRMSSTYSLGSIPRYCPCPQ